VSVGDVRTPFANEVASEIAKQKNEEFARQSNQTAALLSASDITNFELLSEHGPYENVVRSFWTDKSITWVRVRLFGCYLGLLILVNFAIGLIAKTDQKVS
jgi:hypothetical protein